MRFVSLVLLVLLSLVPMADAQGRGYKPLHPERRKELHAHSAAKHGGRLAALARFQSLPAAFDCRDKGWVLPVGDQGQCGSCYLYSTVYGTMSQAFVKAGYGKPDGSLVMAVQFGMDCGNFGGCNGGNGTEVIDWAVKNGWPAEKWVDTSGGAHNDYPPYEASEGRCRKVPGAKLWTPASWGFVAADSNRPATTQEIKTALYNFGPLNVSLDAGGQFGNGTGTITSLGGNIDHEIELVAYDDNKDGGAFLLKNQWTKDWGNAGYRWVTYQAARNLDSVFFVTATPLPPPPDPVPPGPVPPGPIPPFPPAPGGITLTLSGDMKAGTYQLVSPDAVTIRGDMTLKELFDAMQRTVKPTTSAEPPLLKSDTDKRLDNLERGMDAILKALLPVEKKKASLDSRKLFPGITPLPGDNLVVMKARVPTMWHPVDSVAQVQLASGEWTVRYVRGDYLDGKALARDVTITVP
jgi:hypothetical protein